VLFLRFFMKESDRWVASQHERAEEALSHSGVTLGGELSQLLTGAYRWDVLVGSLAFGGLLVGYWASLAWIPMWIHGLLQHPDNARSVAMMSQGVGAILGCSLGGIACNYWGRRVTIMLASLGCLGASWWLFKGHGAVFAESVYMAGGTLGFFIGCLQSSLYVYLPELFPTRVRATATGIALNAGRLLTAVCVFFMAMVVQQLGGYGQAAWAFASAYLVVVVAMLGARETKQQGLID
jgi:predicted MFS family arabinose efflux permease